MKRPPLPLVLAALALLAAPVVIGGLAPGALTHLLVDEDALARPPAAPVVRILAPEDGDGTGLVARVSGEARAESGRLADVQMRLDGGRWESVPGVARNVPLAAFSFTLPLDAGDHVLELRATDGESFSLPTRVALRAAPTPPPAVRIEAPHDGAGVETGGVEIRGTAGGGATRVTIRWGDREVDAPVSAGRWSATIPLHEGAHAIEAQATGARSSLPQRVRVAAAPVAPPEATILLPEPDASVGARGEPACPSACVRVAGASARASTILIALDGAPRGEARLAPDGSWAWELPVADLYGGEHALRATPRDADGREGVPATVRFHLRSARALDVQGDDAPRPTGTPLSFRLLSDGSDRARWQLDGVDVAEGPAALVRLATPGDHLLTVEAPAENGRPASRAIPLFAVNRPPTVALEAGAALATHPARLVASGEDPDGRVVAYRWELGNGQKATSVTGSLLHRYDREGVYRVNVTAVDDRGAPSAPASILVPVLNAPPSASFSWTPESPSVLDDVVFTDHSHDPEGRPALVSWSFGDGAHATGPTVAHRYATRGDHVVMLRVQDADGGVDLVARTLTVRNLPPEPAFTLTPAMPVAGQEVVLEDVSTKPDGEIVERRWRFADGREASGARVVHAFATAGRHEVALTVVDDFGASATRRLEILVDPAPPEILRVRVDPEAPVAGDEVRLLVLARDAEDALVEYRWELGDGARVTTLAPDLTHRYARSGVYAANVTVLDADGLVATLPFVVQVANAPPQASLRVQGQPPRAGLPMGLAADAFDPDGRVTRLRFDADGDGRWDCDGARPLCAFVYEKPGAYEAVLLAEDDEGATVTASLPVEVALPPDGFVPPDVRVLAPEAGATLRGDVLLRGDARGARPVERVEAQVQVGNWSFGAGPTPWTPASGNETWSLLLDTRLLPDGPVDLVVRAVDASGAVGFARVPVTIDNGGPDSLLTLQVADFGADSLVEGDRLVRGTAWHPAGVDVVRWRLDDGPWQGALGVPLRWAVPLEGVAPGAHVLRVAAWHGLDEVREVVLPFTVPDRRPVLVVDVPPDPVLYGLAHVEGHVEGAARVLWRLDHGLWEELPLGRQWTLREPTLGWPGGPRTLSFKAVAFDGGAESEPVTFKVRVLKLEPAPAPPPVPHPLPPRDVPLPAWTLVAALSVAAALRFGVPPRRV